jgi:diacylglycerol kinase family enzyme
MFPNASNSDQLLDVIIFKESGYRLVVEAMRGLALGKLNVSSDMIEYFTASELDVFASAEGPVEADGELVTQCPVQIRRMAKTLRVMAPKGGTGSRFEESLRSIFKR